MVDSSADNPLAVGRTMGRKSSAPPSPPAETNAPETAGLALVLPRAVLASIVAEVKAQVMAELRGADRPEWMTADQLADHLSLSRHAVYRLKARLPHRQEVKGGRLLFNVREVEAELERHREGPRLRAS